MKKTTRPSNWVATVNGHDIYRDEAVYHIWTEGIGWWAFDLSSEADARRTAEAVSSPR